MNKKNIFILLTSAYQLISAEELISKKKKNFKIGIIINPLINNNTFKVIEYNSKFFGYKKIIDLRSLGKKIENLEKMKLFEKFFNKERFHSYQKRKIKFKKLLKEKIKLNKDDIFLIRKKYNVHEQYFFYKNFKYLMISDGLEFLDKYFGKWGLIGSTKLVILRTLSNFLLSLKFLNKKNYFQEIIKSKNIEFSNKLNNDNVKKFKTTLLQIKNRYKNINNNYKVFIFGHPLIEDNKVFNTNTKKDAKIYNQLYKHAEKKFKLKKNEIVLKFHPRVSYKNFRLIKKNLIFPNIEYNDKTLSEILIQSKKIKAIYSFGSNIGFISSNFFKIKNFYVSIRNLDINEKYAKTLDNKISKYNFELLTLNN